MKTIGAFEAKTRLSHYISEVQKKGGEFVILKRGRKAAVLLSYERHDKKLSREKTGQIIDGFRELRDSFKKAPRLHVAGLIREGRKR
jgi:prevent-host-death family protein